MITLGETDGGISGIETSGGFGFLVYTSTEIWRCWLCGDLDNRLKAKALLKKVSSNVKMSRRYNRCSHSRRE